MRFGLVRDRLLRRGIAVLFAGLACGGALDWGHIGGDDPDSAIVLFHHDHGAHRISGAPTKSSPSGDHCYICHSLRLLHHAVTSREQRVAVNLQTVLRLDAAVLALRDGLRVGVSSRAPPSPRL